MAGQATLSQVQALYVAYYGRPAEPAGLNFWANVVEANGGDVSVIIKDFSNAPEYQQRFGSLNDTTLVNNLYLQMFGRSAEPGGLEFWVGLLKAGTQTLGDIAQTISSLASGVDLQVLSGRVDLANAFTTKLAASPEALANYGTERGIEIGRDYLAQVKDATVGSLPALIDKAADTVATLPPADGGGTGGGGVTPPPAPTFVAQIDSGVLHFTGTATGDIAVVRDTAGGIVAFTRDGIKSTVTLSQFTATTSVDIGAATVKLTAADAAVSSITGTGEVLISGVSQTSDLTKLSPSLTVTATLVSDVDLTSPSTLGTVDHFVVSTGHTLTLNAAQYPLLASGAFILKDSVVNVALNPVTSASAVSITLTDLDVSNVSVAQAKALETLQSSTFFSHLTYNGGSVSPNLVFSIKDTAANLIAATTNDVLTHATSITADPAATVSEAIKLNGLQKNVAYAVHDSAANLATADANSITALHGASELTATNSASAAQAQSIHVNAASVLAHYNVSDSYTNIVNSSFADGINAAYDLSANTGNLSTAQAGNIVAFNNGGLTTIYSVHDSAANVNSFVSGNAWNTTLHYSFSVIDSASNILNQIDINQPSTMLFISGNSADNTADHTVTSIYVNSSLDITGAKTFWSAVDAVFASHNKTTADKTTYTIVDTIANYITDENPTGNSAKLSTWVTDADSKTVTGSAADIYQAQQNNRLIFDDLDSSDHIVTTGSAGQQLLQGSDGSDTLYGGDDNDTLYGGAGNDYINGGAGYNYVAGGEGGDTLYAGDAAADTSNGSLGTSSVTTVVGGTGADNMFGSVNKDVFVYAATTAAALIAETGTNANTRDYITSFSQGDTIQFANSAKVQFLGNGSGNASSVAAGDFGVSIRYDKDLTIGGLNGGAAVTGTKVSIDVADGTGRFDNVPDATIILVGQHIDINVVGNTITFGA